MTQTTGFRATARLVRSDARAKLKELREERIARKQRPTSFATSDTVSEDRPVETLLPETQTSSPLSSIPESSIATGELLGLEHGEEDHFGRGEDALDEPGSKGATSDDATMGVAALDVAALEESAPDDASWVTNACPSEEVVHPESERASSWAVSAERTFDAAEEAALAEIDSLDAPESSSPQPLPDEFEAPEEPQEEPANPDVAEKGHVALADPDISNTGLHVTFRTKRAGASDSRHAPYPEPVPTGSLGEPEPSSVQFEPLSLQNLPGIGSGLIWMLNGCGIKDMSDLAVADHSKLTRDLGLVAQILDVVPWIHFAQARVTEVSSVIAE